MSVKTKTILELEKEGRFSESGYGRIFAYNSLHFNAMVDARTKAKFIRELNPDTWDETQNQILYSGPTVFYDERVNIKDKNIFKRDLKSAYPSYLINDEIKKPGVFKMKHDGAVPLSDRIALYVIRFSCDVDNMFVKWFLNASAVQMQKIKTDGKRVWGDISIFSSTWMNLLQYVEMFLEPEEGIIIKSYTFHGETPINIKKSQIRKLYDDKEDGIENAKAMLVQSTGWLSIVDKTIYYHMVQYVKWYLLWTTYRYGLEDVLFGVQTDCLFYVEDESTDTKNDEMVKDMMTMSKEQSTIGTYTVQKVPSHEIITNKARVVVKHG